MVARLDAAAVLLAEPDEKIFDVGRLDVRRRPPAAVFDAAFQLRDRISDILYGIIPRLEAFLKIVEMVGQRTLHFQLRRVDEAVFDTKSLVGELGEHLLRDGLVFGQRDAAFDAVGVAVTAVPHFAFPLDFLSGFRVSCRYIVFVQLSCLLVVERFCCAT